MDLTETTRSSTRFPAYIPAKHALIPGLHGRQGLFEGILVRLGKPAFEGRSKGGYSVSGASLRNAS